MPKAQYGENNPMSKHSDDIVERCRQLKDEYPKYGGRRIARILAQDGINIEPVLIDKWIYYITRGRMA